MLGGRIVQAASGNLHFLKPPLVALRLCLLVQNTPGTEPAEICKQEGRLELDGVSNAERPDQSLSC